MGYFAFFLSGLCVGLWLGFVLVASHLLNIYQIDTMGGDVLNHVCSTKGCSFLIEHKNGTVTWEYAPKLIND